MLEGKMDRKRSETELSGVPNARARRALIVSGRAVAALRLSATLPWLVLFAVSLKGLPRSPVGTAPVDPLTQDVLHTLVSTPLGRTLPPLAYQVAQAQTYMPNAFSYPNGQLYVTLGTSLVLGKQRGLWAGLLSHELGHVLLHHPEYLPAFEREMQNAYHQANLHANDPPQATAPAAKPTAAWLTAELNRRGRHEEEFEADIIGLMLMAEAGYHPQFFLILGRDLNFYIRSSRMTSFLVRHPDWGSRERRLLEVYDAALAMFNSRWPDIAQSPGGKLPALGSIGKVMVRSEGSSLVFRVPFRLANPDRKPVRVALALLEDKKRVPATLPEYRSADGFLVVNSTLPDSTSGAGDVDLRLPLAAIGTRTRKLKAVVFLATEESPIAESQLTLTLP